MKNVLNLLIATGCLMTSSAFAMAQRWEGSGTTEQFVNKKSTQQSECKFAEVEVYLNTSLPSGAKRPQARLSISHAQSLDALNAGICGEANILDMGLDVVDGKLILTLESFGFIPPWTSMDIGKAVGTIDGKSFDYRFTITQVGAEISYAYTGNLVVSADEKTATAKFSVTTFSNGKENFQSVNAAVLNKK